MIFYASLCVGLCGEWVRGAKVSEKAVLLTYIFCFLQAIVLDLHWLGQNIFCFSVWIDILCLLMYGLVRLVGGKSKRNSAANPGILFFTSNGP
jgi:hypothetical protein